MLPSQVVLTLFHTTSTLLLRVFFKKWHFFAAKICQFKKWYYLCIRKSGH